MSERILRIKIGEVAAVRFKMNDGGIIALPPGELSAHKQLHNAENSDDLRKLGEALKSLQDVAVEFDIPMPE